MSDCRRQGSTVTNVVLVLVVGVFAVVAAPMFVRHVDGSPTVSCQSNLNQIGVAIKHYTVDWDGLYPTNRRLLADGKCGPVSTSVALSKTGLMDRAGRTVRFTHGVNWVEGLSNHIEPVEGDPYVAWRCPVAQKSRYAPESSTAAVTYVFNRNLVERKEQDVRVAATLMLARETDRLVDADLRPTNACSKPALPPHSAFLTDNDDIFGETNARPHVTGTNVLFADGHVKLISAEALGPTGVPVWDEQMGAWVNAGTPKGLVSVTP